MLFEAESEDARDKWVLGIAKILGEHRLEQGPARGIENDKEAGKAAAQLAKTLINPSNRYTGGFA